MEKISFIMECINFIFDLVKEPITKIVKNNSNKKNNIYIFITGYNNENPFSIDLKKSTPIDFASWHKKMKTGGKIILNFEYVGEMKKYLKKKNINEKERKECYEGIERIEEVGVIVKLMVEKALTEEVVSRRIQEFSVFVEGTVNKCFQFIKPNSTSEKYLRTLEVYNGSKSFKFHISESEYANVLKVSEGKIEVYMFIYFSEFMNCITDKSILEREIMPTYLKENAIREIYGKKEIAIDDFYNWWISVG